MRATAFLAVLFVISSAQAGLEIGKPCDFNDFHRITQAAKSNQVEKDPETQSTIPHLLDILGMEMGPTCNHLIETSVVVSNPEMRNDLYLIVMNDKQTLVTLGFNKIARKDTKMFVRSDR